MLNGSALKSQLFIFVTEELVSCQIPEEKNTVKEP